jgi:predicted enzyme related to lactoylglutathione lyase
MRKTLVAFSVILSLGSFAAHAADAPGAPMSPAPIVFFDIAGPDSAKLRMFYSSIFGWQIDATGGIKTPRLEGTLREDPPEKIIYMGVPDIDAALKAIEAAGGKTVLPRTVVPNVTTFALFTDPAGNRMGLVEIKN